MYAIGTIFLSLLAAANVNGLVLAIGRSRRISRVPVNPSPDPDVPGDGGDIDLSVELRIAGAQSVGDSSPYAAKIEFAVREGLTLRTNRATLRAVVTEVVGCALREPACSHVLVSAVRQVGRIRIAVTDDSLATATSARESALRGASALVALQGGSLHVVVHPGAGTTVAVHLPLPLTPVVSRSRRADVRDTVRQPETIDAGDF